MKTYIGCKLIKAVEMKRSQFCEDNNQQGSENESKDEDGYQVHYPDGYISWSPKDVFEEAYREISLAEMKLVLEYVGEG